MEGRRGCLRLAGCFLLLIGLVWTGCAPEPIAHYGEGGRYLTGAYCDDTDTYLAVWYRSSWYGSEIRAATISAAGEVLVPKETLVDTTVLSYLGFFRLSPVRILYDKEDQAYFMTWTEHPETPGEENVVMGVSISQEGASGAPFPIGVGELRDMIYNQTAREYLLAMRAENDGPDLGLRLSPTGELLADPFPLGRTGAEDRVVKLVFNPDENQYMSVNVSGNTGTESDPSREIYAGIFAPDGSPQGDAFTVMSLSHLVDWYIDDRILAGYLPGGQNYVIFIQLERQIGSLRFQQTYGQRISPSGDLLGGNYVVNTDLTPQLAGMPSPRPALVIEPASGSPQFVFHFLHAILASQELTATGMPQGPMETLGMTAFPINVVGGDWGPGTEFTVVVSSDAPKGLALWNKMELGLGLEFATYGMIVDLF
jgi:hypothetical protein